MVRDHRRRWEGTAHLPGGLVDGATARLLSKVVDVLDEATGTVRLKKVEAADEMALDTRSTRTVRVKND